MRTGSSDIQFQGYRGRIRPDARPRKARKSRHPLFELEGLESRTLLATIPAATPSGSLQSLTSLSTVTNNGNANSPTVVIDPYDSQKLIAVWGVDLTQLTPPPFTVDVVEGAYSNNGGASWNSLGSFGPLFDPATINNTSPPFDYTEVIDPSVDFDSQGNAFVLTLQTLGASDGALALNELNFSGSTPNAVSLPNNGIIYQWVTGADGATSPTLAIDSGTGPGAANTDPYINNVYIAWASIDHAPAGIPAPFNAEPYFNPDRAEVVVGTPVPVPSVPNETSLAFSGVTTVNLNGNYNPAASGEQDSHPQLVINPGSAANPGQITIGWEDFGTGAGFPQPTTLLMSNIVQPGDSYGFDGQTGLILPATANTSPGNWGTATVYPAGIATSTNPADPVGIAVAANVNGNSTNVSPNKPAGDTSNDIVLADQGTSDIGVLLNSGTGTFGATSVYSASANTSGITLGDLVAGHTTSTILDAATSSTSSGAVSVLSNGTPPLDGAGAFGSPKNLGSVGQGESAIVTADLDGNGVADIVAADPGNQSIDIWMNPSSTTPPNPVPFALQLPSGDVPVAVVVNQFRGGGALPDIAVLNSNGSIVIFQNEIVAGNPVNAGSFSGPILVGTVSNAVTMTSGFVTGSTNLADLVVVTDGGGNELVILQNNLAGGFDAPRVVPNSNMPGSPVGGEQGVAIGILSSTGNYSAYQDIAVVYAAFGSRESMVAVFQNLDNGSFARTGTTDFDAEQRNPTAIALLNLTNSATLHWEDIVVTNNDNFDRNTFAGTVSVLQPAATPTLTQPTPTSFSNVINVPNPNAINNLTVTIDLTDQQSVQNLSLVVVAPNGDQITLVQNQNNSAGTANTGRGLPGGNAIGQFGYAPASTPGIAVGTIFDDNATRNIFDPSTTGTNANAAPYIGFFRPEGSRAFDTLPGLPIPEADTLSNFVKYEAGLGDINGPWKLVVTNYTSTAPAAGFLQDFSLHFSTGMTDGTPHSIASDFPSATGVGYNAVVLGALGNNYPTAAPSTPNGVGPGLVLAEDDTLGPGSPYKGRIYAAFTVYHVVEFPPGVKNPTTNTDIYMSYSDNGGSTWSTPVEVNDDASQSDGYSQSNDYANPDQVTGRTQFQPEIAVDQATGTVVLSWRDARDNAANALVATYITASIDGGQTFNDQVYANPPETAIDAITDLPDVLGPMPDNQSGGDPQRNTPFGYGTQMGLAVFNGQVYPIWAGNLNQSYISNGAVLGRPLNILYQPMVIAAGPRIIASTMGPISYPEDYSTGTVNNVSISVTFDRPITASSFTIADVLVYFHGTSDSDSFVPLTVLSISPSSGTATQFTITFDPTPPGATHPLQLHGYV